MYVGVPIWFGRKRNEDFKFLSIKVQSAILGWEANFLFRAGKTCLIKSVSNVLANYAMSSFHIPKKVLANIDYN